MSIVRTDELATHLGLSTPPNKAQGALDAAETLVASYLGIEYARRGDALQEHTVSERIRPVRDRGFLEINGGHVTGVESIAYNVTGYRHTGDEVGDDYASETPSFSYVFSCQYSGWTVSGRNVDGSQFVFRKGVEYRVTYRTGWCAGRTAYAWQWYRNSVADTWDNGADRLGWDFVGGTAASQNNSGGDYLFGPHGSTVEGIHYETGGSGPTDERLLSPAISFDGGAYPFIQTRVKLLRASTAGYPAYRVGWIDGDGRTYLGGKKSERSELNFLPDRIRASTQDDSTTGHHLGYTNLTVDMGYNPASDIEPQMQDPARSWIDQTITQISMQLWDGGASDPNGALFKLDYVRIVDGTAVIPESVRLAVLETARALTSGGGSGIASESIGDYSRSLAPGEAGNVIPPAARQLLAPHRRPNW